MREPSQSESGEPAAPTPRVLGVSGSPHPHSNTDRLVHRVLEASGLPWEFVKLSEILVRPCRACLGCVSDNICKEPDDFPALAEKLKAAEALLVGCYPPYGTVDAYTKAFLERFYSLRHRRGLNQGKLAVVVATGNARGARGVEAACDQVSHALGKEGMEVLGCVTAVGNPNCLVCGHGPECAWSALRAIYPDRRSVTPDMFRQVEDQAEVWARAGELGRELGRRLTRRTA
ncbi:MAG: flavodoxin family protein [Deltaproteobacteria bacterium]|nr:flavodoxin family protein [Deltaproteobacteria bacterium]